MPDATLPDPDSPVQPPTVRSSFSPGLFLILCVFGTVFASCAGAAYSDEQRLQGEHCREAVLASTEDELRAKFNGKDFFWVEKANLEIVPKDTAKSGMLKGEGEYHYFTVPYEDFYNGGRGLVLGSVRHKGCETLMMNVTAPKEAKHDQ